jgi:uncharacterized NAD(P)/FAD-binding protein YdhS
MREEPRRIAIIGAGFSGSLLAVQLLRRSLPQDRIYLLERSAEFGRGLAYATGNRSHLLNVRAGNMSAFSDQPNHFLDWLRNLPEEDKQGAVSTTADRLAFVSRWTYGSYIQHILASQIWGLQGPQRLSLVGDEAIGLKAVPEGYSLETALGRRYDVDTVVLAVGNLPPDGDTPGYVANPWDPAAVASLDGAARVLLVGTGLTMVDVVISLLDQQHRGVIRAISRRGLLPRIHAAAAPYPRFLPAESAPRNALRLLEILRREIRKVEAAGGDWRSVIDSLRPDTQDLWRNLPLPEKQRFLRYLRPWWDVHRHRMAPDVAERIGSTVDRGQLVIERARLGRMQESGGGMDVELLPVGGGRPTRLKVGRIINCSGLVSDISKARTPLIRGLLEAGMARADELDFGLDVTADGAVIDARGRTSGGLFAVGPITRGVFWETIAVPDIRIQCERLAAHLFSRDGANAPVEILSSFSASERSADQDLAHRHAFP